MVDFSLGFPPRIDNTIKGAAYIFYLKAKTAKESFFPSAERACKCDAQFISIRICCHCCWFGGISCNGSLFLIVAATLFVFVLINMLWGSVLPPSLAFGTPVKSDVVPHASVRLAFVQWNIFLWVCLSLRFPLPLFPLLFLLLLLLLLLFLVPLLLLEH